MTFTAGTKVRVTPQFAIANYDKDGTMQAMVGKEGVVEANAVPYSQYVQVVLYGDTSYNLFLPEELEAV